MTRNKETSAPDRHNPDSPFLEKAARAVGAALGTLAVTTGVATVTPEAGHGTAEEEAAPPESKKKKAKAKLVLRSRGVETRPTSARGWLRSRGRKDRRLPGDRGTSIGSASSQ